MLRCRISLHLFSFPLPVSRRNCSCVVAGTGTLGMPHAVAQSGWLGTLVVLLALFMSTTTGNMLIECLYLKSNVRRTSYQEIAHDAYGKVGHYVAFGTVGVNLFGCAVLYVILAATLIQTMVSDIGHVNEPVYFYIIGCTFFVWVCLIFTKTMKEIALLSIIGAGATIGVVMITVGVSADMMIHRASVTLSAAHKLIDWSKIPLSLATISFAYGGNVVYPHMEQTMRHPRSWSKALWIALTACLFMYMSIAVAGYLAFGSATMSPVLKNLPQGAWSAIANSLITLHVLLAAPILLTSLAMMVEACISARSPNFAQGTSRQQFLKRAIPRTIIILLAAFIASVIPFFGDVMDLLGALTTCLLVFVMPIMFYYRLGGMKTMRWWGRLWAWFIFLVGMVALVLGTYDATRHLIADFKQK
ncbi:transmembrane amino acid transporter protein-domain-containing protein [Dissophora ornata]|nr:transmembrane amino acid transporter protein-domain-containing protein [Dissophora ornata]